MFASPVMAQTLSPATDVNDPQPPAPAAPTNTVPCFNYYTFGSVQAVLTTPLSGVVSGSSVPFSGSLKNNNPYPIVDGALYVKVFRSRGSEKDSNGPDVVDAFFVKSGIAIPANGSVPVSFSWNVPAYARSGDYSIATFFTVAHKFNLLGLSFTDDVVGNTVPFAVKGELHAGVGFDKTGVRVNGELYHFAAFPPTVSATSAVTIQASVTNTTHDQATAEVTWTVYQWDAQSQDNIVQQVPAEQVRVPAGASVPLSISVTDTEYPVYYAVGTLKWKDTTSIIGVRFVRSGLDRLRIGFLGTTAYPLKTGAAATLYACIYNGGTSPRVSNGRLELNLLDHAGTVIRSHTYTGDVTADPIGIIDSFMPSQDADNFTLDARLYQGAALLDETQITYDCNVLSGKTCAVDASAWDETGDVHILVSDILGLLLVLAVVAWVAIWVIKRSGRASVRP